MFLQFFKYNIVGIINTLIGFSIIYVLMIMGVSPVKSNAIGYSIGAILSYFLNKRYTFKVDKHDTMQVFKFFMVLGVSYLLNLMVLQGLLDTINPYSAQFIAATFYTLSTFILFKLFVFNDASS